MFGCVGDMVRRYPWTVVYRNLVRDGDSVKYDTLRSVSLRVVENEGK